MKDGLSTLAIGGVLLALLSACGGAETDRDGDAPDLGTVAGEDLRRGVFVDSPVENLSWSTASRSGVTGTDGGFAYLPGERVTFSIGALRLPAVEAAPRLTPLDLARGASDPESFSVNLARLLQTLDVDGRPDNGIELVGEASNVATAINFDMATDAFEQQAAVMNLVAGSGGVRTELVSEERAREHFGRALAEGGLTGSTRAIAGLWEIDHESLPVPELGVNPDGSRIEVGVHRSEASHYGISENGELTIFSRSYETYEGCTDVGHYTLTSLGEDDYLVSSVSRGGMTREGLAVVNGRLHITFGDTDSTPVVASVASDGAVASLSLCPGQSLQRPPPNADMSRSIAGLWESSRDGGVDYYQVSAHSFAEALTRRDVFGPGPEYAPSICYDSLELDLYTDGDGGFVADAVSPWAWESRTLELVGDSLRVSGVYGDADIADRLTRSGVDAAALVRCGASADRHPLDAVAGLWRHEGDGPFGHYVAVDRRQGSMKTYAPTLGGLDCFVETNSTLVSVGGLDFVRQLADGSERTLRMEPSGERLIVSEVGDDGETTPVYWLESIVGLDVEALSRCQMTITPDDLGMIAPLAGVWARTISEYKGPYGPDRSIIVYERQEQYWTVGANGRLERAYSSTELVDRSGGRAEYRTCRSVGLYEPVQIDPVGGDVFRIGGSAWTLEREESTLTATTTYEEQIFERSDADLSSMEPCDSLAASRLADGLWLLEPFEPGKAGALLLLSDFAGSVQVPVDGRSCNRFLSFEAQALADGRMLLSGEGEDGNATEAVVRFTVVDDQLEIVLDSADPSFSLAGGRYPRARGLNAYQLRYSTECH